MAPLHAFAAPGDDAEAAYLRGRRLESALGDLEGALEAYREAASSPSPERRASARLREAEVLRTLGRRAEARAAIEALMGDTELGDPHRLRTAARDLLERLSEPPASADTASPEVEALREQKKDAEREVLGLRRELDAALRTSADVEELRDRLRDMETERQSILDRLREAERDARGARGDLTEEERGAREREDERARKLLSAEWTRYGRELYMAARFEDARRFLRRAVELDASNLSARQLLASASAPYGEGEQLASGILEVLALEQELRAEQVRAEVARLVEDGRLALSEGRPADAMAAFEGALGHLDGEPGLRDRLEGARDQTAALFDEAARRAGSERRAPAPPDDAGADPSWRAAIRALMEEAGSAGESGGASLRILPLGSLERAQRAILPPAPVAGEPLRRFVLGAETPPLGPLLAAAVRASVRPDAWRAPGTVLRSVGGSLVARAGPDALAALEETLALLAAAPDRSLQYRVMVIPCTPGDLVEALAAQGATLETQDSCGAATAVLGPGSTTPLLEALGGVDGCAASARFRVASRRASVLEARLPAGPGLVAGLRLEALAWVRPDGTLAAGVSVAVDAEAVPGASSSLGASVLAGQRALRGVVFSPGAALVFGGLSNPFRSGGSGEDAHCAVVVEIGTGGEAPPAAGAGRVLPLLDLPGRSPDLPGPLTSEALDPRSTRAESIRRWLEGRSAEGVVVSRRGAGLRVDASEAATTLVERDLDRLRASTAPTACEVRAWALRGRDEAALVKGMVLDSPAPDTDVRLVRLHDRARMEARFLLEGTGRRVALGGAGPVAIAPAQRVAFSRSEGSAVAGNRRLADLEVGVRLWPGDLPGERWLWIDVAHRAERDAEVERAPLVRVPLREEHGLLLVGLANPFADADEYPRLAVWVRIAPGDE